MQSNYLDGIIAKQHGSQNAAVVFLDVIKYSLRKSVMQQRVINAFNEALRAAITSVSAKFVAESQRQNLNLSSDIILIPTGDGAAIVMPFEGLQGAYLELAKEFVHQSVAQRGDQECAVFEKDGWCNCHSFFDVRVGVSEGKAIIFKDVNDNYNVAGGTINMASRVMGLADRQQILFTGKAYRATIDMTEDTQIERRFRSHGSIPIKHDLTIEVYQYVGEDENFINRDIPIQVQITRREEDLKSSPIFKGRKLVSPTEKLASLEIMDILKEMPVPPGFAGMMATPNLTKESAQAIVDAFKAVDGLMRSGAGQTLLNITGKEEAD